MVRFTRGTISGGTPAVRGGLYVYTPHVAGVSCGDVECPGNMVSVELMRTFVPLDARDTLDIRGLLVH